MPLGIVSAEDYEKERNPKGSPTSRTDESAENKPESADSQDNTEKPEESVPAINNITRIGRGQGSTAVPQSIRKLIGESSVEEGSRAAQAIGKFLGLSQSSISAYSNGATSTASYNKPNGDLVHHLNKTRERITKRASGKLMLALNHIDDNSMKELDALEASSVARNMSAIVKNMEPDTRTGPTFNGPVITFYAPSIVTEDRFETITVQE